MQLHDPMTLQLKVVSARRLKTVSCELNFNLNSTMYSEKVVSTFQTESTYVYRLSYFDMLLTTTLLALRFAV